MQMCIQDPANHTNYVLNENELQKFSVTNPDEDREIDVLLVAAGDTLLQELPSSRLSDSATPTVQIVDPDSNRIWIIGFDDLKLYETAAPPTEAEDMVWFAMPTARSALAAVPVLRRAMVQHSS